MNLPKPTPPGGDALPFVVTGSSAASSAPTVAVIGDSVARDYAYYLGRRLGPHGVRVIDGALSGCPIGTLPFLSTIHDITKKLRGGDCPKLVKAKQNAIVTKYAPPVILWHSITEIWDIEGATGKVPSGSEEWSRKVMAQWDDTLARVGRGGAQVVVILPLWYERSAPHRLDVPGPSVEKLRDLYVRWAARHRGKVSIVDVAPLVCPTGPPCGPVNGIDFRPDTTHYDDPGGSRVADYLTAHVPALTRLDRAAKGSGA
ncbi:SGNH hydrolase domain-containing protein [Actinoallomurus acaciae]|uniref:SGNH hydrolase domain-containing protein n=1 Tax=Actinoallomurus acaciae TaxID=502577 RepID=A0ABV5YXJ8_9ACTN